MGKKLGGLIRTARTNAGLTQAQLAALVDGASQSDIGRFERGEAEPTTAVVKSIAKACGVTQKSLLDAMPKTTSGRTSSSSRTTSSSSRTTSSSSSTTVKLTTTEKKLLALYRAADTDTRKKAMQVLAGENSSVDDVLAGLGNVGNMDDLLAGLGNLLGDTLFKK